MIQIMIKNNKKYIYIFHNRYWTTTVGFTNLVSSAGVTTSGVTTSIASFNASEVESLYANVEVVNDTTNDINFVELYVATDGTNTYLSEYYFDSESDTSFSNNFIGSFGATLSSGSYH
jgi:hypothetical protein